MEQLVFTLTSTLNTRGAATGTFPAQPTPAALVTVYKSMMVLHFVCAHCPRIVEHVKTFYHEEIK